MQQEIDRDLWQNYIDSDRPITLRNELIERNQRLIRRLLPQKRYLVDKVGYEDFISIATLGLIKAVERFDLSKECKFSNFAYPYMIGAVKQYIRDHHQSVRYPQTQYEKALRFQKASEKAIANAKNHQKYAVAFSEVRKHLSEKDKSTTEKQWQEILQGWYNCQCTSFDVLQENNSEIDIDKGMLDTEIHIDCLPPLTEGDECRDSRVSKVLSRFKSILS